MSGTHLSKEFFELLKAIGESKSKQEEDRIIDREVTCLKKKLESPPPSSKTPGLPAHLNNPINTSLTNKKRAKEFLVRLLYVEMLGQDGSFGYIKAVELAAASLIAHKRVGYLVCGSCLPPEHEFRFMLVNQMQRDLNSPNVLETCAALIAVTRIITPDMVPAIGADVGKLILHGSEVVRKKAVMALHRFYQIAPECIGRIDLVEKLRRVLCDRDPSVMGASLNVIECMAQMDATPFKDLIPSLISILKQICEHRLPSDYDYHRVPAPWMQMKIIRILAILGKKDANASNGIYEILGDTMKRADVGINAGYAVVYECVRTITIIYPNPTLLDAAAEAISRFISSRSHNLKYLGITGLAAIVESHPQYAARHQLAVIECLEDRDETLQRKTLDLLYRMTNPVNVEFITAKLLQFLRGTTDPFLKSSLSAKICSIAERYAPTNAWYIDTVTELFEISGDLVKSSVAQNLMSLIAEGTGGEEEEEEEADLTLRRNAVELYVKLLDKPKLPRILTETVAWVLGEYAYLSETHTLPQILDKLCLLARKQASASAPPSTLRFLTSAIMKLVAQAGTCPPNAAHVIDDFTKSSDHDLQQRCLEFQNLLTSASHVLGDVLPVDASCEDVDVDIDFLEDFAQQALQRGCSPYEKPEEDSDDDVEVSKPTSKGLRFEAYERPKAPSSLSYAMREAPVQPAAGYGPADTGPMPIGGAVETAAPAAEAALQLRTVANVWGKGGLTSQPAAIPVSAPAAAYPPAANPYASTSYVAEPEPDPEQPRELTEKERMAAALFGGIVPGAAPAVPVPVPVPREPKPTAPPTPTPAPAPVSAPAPTPVPAPEIDLLDFDFTSTPASAPAPKNLDPFFSAFQHNSHTLSPLKLQTPDFGQKWITIPHSSTSSHPTSLNSASEFASVCEKLGLHNVEVISKTNEGIAAGEVNQKVVLVHGKMGKGKVDVTIKSEEEGVAGKLNEYLKGVV